MSEDGYKSGEDDLFEEGYDVPRLEMQQVAVRQHGTVIVKFSLS